MAVGVTVAVAVAHGTRTGVPRRRTAIDVAEAPEKVECHPSVTFAQSAAREGFTELPFTATHASALRELAWHHRDPFDRMLVAQALVEGATSSVAIDGWASMVSRWADRWGRESDRLVWTVAGAFSRDWVGGRHQAQTAASAAGNHQASAASAPPLRMSVAQPTLIAVPDHPSIFGGQCEGTGCHPEDPGCA